MAIVWVGLIAGCGPAALEDVGIVIENLELEPRRIEGPLADVPTGPLVEVMRGSVAGVSVKFTAQEDANGACIGAYRGSDGVQACGQLPGDQPEFGPFGITFPGGPEDDPRQVGGLVASDVASVVAELAGGGRAEALMVSLDPAGIDAQGFLIYLPKGAAERWLVAMGADGAELSRLEFHPAP